MLWMLSRAYMRILSIEAPKEIDRNCTRDMSYWKKMASAKGDTANIALDVCTDQYHHYHRRFLPHSSPERAGHIARENKTSTPN